MNIILNTAMNATMEEVSGLSYITDFTPILITAIIGATVMGLIMILTNYEYFKKSSGIIGKIIRSVEYFGFGLIFVVPTAIIYFIMKNISKNYTGSDIFSGILWSGKWILILGIAYVIISIIGIYVKKVYKKLENNYKKLKEE